MAMTRLEPENEQPVTIISKEDFAKDLKRGYCITEYEPERMHTVTDRFTGKKAYEKLPQIRNYGCMYCVYATTDEQYIKQHIFRNEHWSFNAFQNPYGHFSVVQVEGIEPAGMTYAGWLKENIK